MLESGRTNSRFCGRSFWDWIFNHLPPQRPNSVRLPVQMLELTISRRGRNMHFLFLERLPRPTEVEHSLQLPHFVHSGRKRINFVVKKEGKNLFTETVLFTLFFLCLWSFTVTFFTRSMPGHYSWIHDTPAPTVWVYLTSAPRAPLGPFWSCILRSFEKFQYEAPDVEQASTSLAKSRIASFRRTIKWTWSITVG